MLGSPIEDAGVKPSVAVYNSVLSLLAESYGSKGARKLPHSQKSD